MRLSRVQFTVRESMLGVLAVGLLLALPSWLRMIAESIVWTGKALDNGGFAGSAISIRGLPVIIENPRLCTLVIPVLTAIVLRTNAARMERWVGVTAVGLCLASWFMLRRPFVGP